MMKTTLLFTSVFLVFTVTANSQIVNIEKKRLTADTTGFAGSVDLNLSLNKNTRTIIQAGNNIKLLYSWQKSKLLFLNDLDFIQAEDDKLLNNGFQHLRYNRRITRELLTAEAFVQNQYNSIQKINIRILGGGGLRYRVINRDSISIYVGTLGMYEYEEVSGNEAINRDTRLSNYLSLNWLITDNLTFNVISYYQPKINLFGDFRFSGEAGLTFDVSTRVGLKLVYEWTYDSRPPTDIPELIYGVFNALSYKF